MPAVPSLSLHRVTDRLEIISTFKKLTFFTASCEASCHRAPLHFLLWCYIGQVFLSFIFIIHSLVCCRHLHKQRRIFYWALCRGYSFRIYESVCSAQWRFSFAMLYEMMSRCCPEHCELIPDSGSCSATLRRWYFDSVTGDCKTFIWGGCDGNNNRFRSRRQCERRCKGWFNSFAQFFLSTE